MKYRQFVSHPWHGIPIGPGAPEIVTAFIEIVPTDTVKYEIDKESGYLKVDRPQKFSNIIPALYGFIPQTYCNRLVADYCMKKINRTNIKGDKDPLDICVFSERTIMHGNILLQAKPIGGFRMIDNDEADDKIIAVLSSDELYANWNTINDVPEHILNRLKHYFLTYKSIPGIDERKCEITHTYNKEEAYEVIKASIQDYKDYFN
jgi:inorganic pyrophosphatase